MKILIRNFTVVAEMLFSTTLGIAPVVAQTDQSARFEAASLKPLPPLPPPPPGEQIVSERVIRNAPVGSGGSVDPGRMHSVATLREFAATAYDVREAQIVGPPWIETDRFVLDATMPPETTRDQRLAMLRNLLADRFRLTIRHETRNLPTYVLVLAKGGTRMKESPEQASSIRIVTVGSRVTITAQSATMADLAAHLTRQLDGPVEDETNTKARYEFVLSFSSEGADLPDVFSALSQLGLKLSSQKLRSMPSSSPTLSALPWRTDSRHTTGTMVPSGDIC